MCAVMFVYALRMPPSTDNDDKPLWEDVLLETLDVA